MADEVSLRKVLPEAALVFLPSLVTLGLVTLGAWTRSGMLGLLSTLAFIPLSLIALALLNARRDLSRFGDAFCGLLGGCALFGLNFFISLGGCVSVSKWLR